MGDSTRFTVITGYCLRCCCNAVFKNCFGGFYKRYDKGRSYTRYSKGSLGVQFGIRGHISTYSL